MEQVKKKKNFHDKLFDIGIIDSEKSGLEKLMEDSTFQQVVALDIDKVMKFPELKKERKMLRQLKKFNETKTSVEQDPVTNLFIAATSDLTGVETYVYYNSWENHIQVEEGDMLKLLLACGKKKWVDEIKFQQVFSKVEANQKILNCIEGLISEMEVAKLEMEKVIRIKVGRIISEYENDGTVSYRF